MALRLHNPIRGRVHKRLAERRRNAVVRDTDVVLENWTYEDIKRLVVMADRARPSSTRADLVMTDELQKSLVSFVAAVHRWSSATHLLRDMLAGTCAPIVQRFAHHPSQKGAPNVDAAVKLTAHLLAELMCAPIDLVFWRSHLHVFGESGMLALDVRLFPSLPDCAAAFLAHRKIVQSVSGNTASAASTLPSASLSSSSSSPSSVAPSPATPFSPGAALARNSTMSRIHEATVAARTGMGRMHVPRDAVGRSRMPRAGTEASQAARVAMRASQKREYMHIVQMHKRCDAPA